LQVTITGHSGGGGFDFGAIEAADQIPNYVDRIALLDSNYSFDVEKHAAQFESWLTGGDSRRLVVIAYDDREIMLDGKKVVGPTGGTFRATGRMRDALGKVFPLTESDNPPFHETVGLDGRIHYYVHPNPQNKIHRRHQRYEQPGPRSRWARRGNRGHLRRAQATQVGAPEPTPREVPPMPPKQSPPVKSQSQLPPRPAGAMSGTAFVESLAGLNLADRETAIHREITSGNFPEFLRNFKVVAIRDKSPDGKEVVATLEVMPDYLAVGGDDDFVRMPMTPNRQPPTASCSRGKSSTPSVGALGPSAFQSAV
jgi:hypothetical protein